VRPKNYTNRRFPATSPLLKTPTLLPRLDNFSFTI